MHILADGFSYPKVGNRSDENEDSFWPAKADDSLMSFTAAVSDGATQSIFAGFWSKLLVEHFGREGLSDGHERFREQIRRLQELWLTRATERPLPWYAERKVQQGAFASLLALRIFESTEAPLLRWSSTAIGDSCLFHLRGTYLLTTYPLNCSADFENNPHLICSSETGNGEVETKILSVGGECHVDDSFFLMTDMVARCTLRLLEDNESPWEALLSIESPESFAKWVEEQRMRLGIKHDDATMLRIQIG